MRYKHPWGAQSDAPTILLLPSFERGFLDGDRVPHRSDAMRQVAMQTLAVSGELAFYAGVLSPGRLVSLTLLPFEATLALFDTALFVGNSLDYWHDAAAPSCAAVAVFSWRQVPAPRRT